MKLLRLFKNLYDKYYCIMRLGSKPRYQNIDKLDEAIWPLRDSDEENEFLWFVRAKSQKNSIEAW